MNNLPPHGVDEYLEQADSWARDRNESLRSALRIAWRVAVAAMAIALLEGLALILLTPLKSVVPYTLLVDRHTGYVQLLKPVDEQRISADSALTQSFLAQYVIAREEFDISSVQTDYRKVGLWSAGPARAGYIQAMQASNNDSPLVRLPRNAIVEVQIKSIGSLTANTSIVRFDTVRSDAGVQAALRQSWMAVVTYGYSAQPMSVEDRMINPLGFKVTRYRKSLETAPVDSTTTVTTDQQTTMAPLAVTPATAPALVERSQTVKSTTVTRSVPSGPAR